MNLTARSFLSLLALGLAAVTAVSAAVLGLAAPLTVSGFSLLAVYALFEIALVSYVPAQPVHVRRATLAPAASVPAVALRRGVPAVVEYPIANARHAA